MQYQHYKPVTHTAIPGLSLKNIWDVEADQTYDVYPKRFNESTHIAVRTFNGRGKIILRNGHRFALLPNTLAFCRTCELQNYACSETFWTFKWYEFEISGALTFPLNTAHRMAIEEQENAYNKQLFDFMTQTPDEGGMATAHFSILYQYWLTAFSRNTSPSLYGAAINRIIRIMHHRLGDRWSVKEMADEVGICERRFRDIFFQHTGKPPKRFYDDLRLEHAKQRLHFTSDPIALISDTLGFSNPFHFSKDYRKKFGYPPSEERQA